jgi:phospholipid/cholesterol/gamma-HCH transport system ATP-binding protein
MRSENGNPVIAISRLRKSFGEETVLNGIDLKVQEGETFVLLGRSGVGKSVLLKIIVGLQQPDSGSVQIHGAEITGLSLDCLNRVRKKIGFLFQSAALYDSLTVRDNVAFPLRYSSMTASEKNERVHLLLSRVGVEEASEKLPSQISGGMKKRVGLARALSLEPEILLCDEPTSGLDPITAGEINDLINSLQEGRNMTSIVVTHDLHSAKSISDHVALLHRGNIVMQGAFEDLQNSADEFVKTFVQRTL